MTDSALGRVTGMLIGGVAVLLALIMFVGLLSAVSHQQSQCADGVPLSPGLVPVADSGVLAGVRVASWNTYARNSTGRIAGGIAAIGRSADIIGLQELNPKSLRDAVERALPDFGFTQGNNSVQIVWRKDTVDLMAQGSIKVFDVERIESGVAGTSIGPKIVQWVQLKQRTTGAVFFVINHHIVPSIENGGRPDDRKPRRIALYQKQMDALVKLITRLRPVAPVMVTGDFNVDARADARVQDPRWPYARLGRLGLWSSWRSLKPPPSGTHGRRLIDYVWSTTTNVRPVAHAILGQYGSDHHAVAVSLNGTASTTRRSAGAATTQASSVTDAARQRPQVTTTLPKVDGLSATQVRIAQTIYTTTVAVGRAEQWPRADIEHAFVIAASTALKESTMLADPSSRRPDANHDSGLFQQRVLPGWYGTNEQVNDPVYGTRAFLLGVEVTAAGVAAARHNGTEAAGPVGYAIPGLQQVDGWPRLSVSQAQHRVQRSAFPNMPPRLEALGRNLLAAFKGSTDLNGVVVPDAPPRHCLPNDPEASGNTDGSPPDCPVTDMPSERGLKPSALYALRCVADKFPKIQTIGGYYPSNAGEHPLYRAIDIMIPDWQSADGIALGTQIAEWVRANHEQMNVMYVVWRKKIWNVQRDAEGWRECGSPAASCYSGSDPSAAHLNHVHVSVFPGNPQGFTKTGSDPGSSDITAGGHSWVMPLAAGSYRVGCSMTCYSGHTGQDFPAADGTNLVSVSAGTVIRSEALRDGDGNYRSYGNLIVIRPTGQPNIELYYAHLSSRDVRTGQTVRAGQHIGRTGNTGNSSGPHLHFEIRIGGSPRDPMPILRKQGVRP